MSKNYFLTGIGGTGMASLAVMLKQKGYSVTGSDSGVYPPVSDVLRENGISYFKGFSEQNLINSNPDVVVIGNVASRGNPEVEHILAKRLPNSSMPETLRKEFIAGKHSIVITGTHGKTTTTSLMAHVFNTAGQDPGFMIGGYPGNFPTPGRIGGGKYFITEGDEYDTAFFDKRSKFFHYAPDSLLINNIEFDHGDIFMNLDEIIRAFRYVQRLVPPQGLIVANGDDANVRRTIDHKYCRVLTFGKDESNDAVIADIHPAQDKRETLFSLSYNNQKTYWKIPLIGEFNVRNAVGVILVAWEQGITTEVIQSALHSFISPAKRLRERTPADSSIKVFEGFAHHPTAIKCSIDALRETYPKHSLIAVYEPRSNTSVRAFHQKQMASAFFGANTALIYKLHRGESITDTDRLNVPQIVAELNAQGITAEYMQDFGALKDKIMTVAKPDDIILVMSQGNFDGLADDLAEHFGK